MPIYRITDSRLTPIKEKEIDLEKDIQVLTGSNLETVFGLQFVRHEFSLQNFRIDTLAYDRESKAFVIIEYKRDKNFSVIDQGYSYLALMLNNKADFILEYNERLKGNLKRSDVDWTQSRILFLSRSFTSYQLNAMNFRDMPIELWEVKVFDNSTILYNQLIAPETKESIKSVTKNKTIEKVSREVKVYKLDDHLKKASKKAKSLFLQVRERILAMGDGIEERPQKLYIAYRTQRNFVEIELQREKLKIHIDIPVSKLNDPQNIGRDVKNVGHFGTGETEIQLNNVNEILYVLGMIEQSYKYSKQ